MLAIDTVTGRVVRIIRGTEPKKAGLVPVRLPDGSRAMLLPAQLVAL